MVEVEEESAPPPPFLERINICKLSAKGPKKLSRAVVGLA